MSSTTRYTIKPPPIPAAPYHAIRIDNVMRRLAHHALQDKATYYFSDYAQKMMARRLAIAFAMRAARRLLAPLA